MTLLHNIPQRILTLCLGVMLALGSLVWIQASARPAAAQEPETGEPTLSIQIVPEGENLSIAEVSPAPVFDVGDTFRVSVVALNVEDPGLFGSQFEVYFDTTYLRAVEDSLVPGSATQPVVNPVKEIDNENGLVRFAASRQGNLENLTGNVVLATLSFEAVAATEPPEGQTTTIDLENVKLGAKGGIAVPVSGVVDLDVIIRGIVNGEGDMVGTVIVQGRALDNQAGHTVTAVGDLGGVYTTTTEIDGAFLLDEVAADTYTVTADRPGFLAASCEAVAHSAEALTELLDATLLAGDIDGSHEIDITDAVAIGAVFGSTDPAEVADLNADGEVDILDLILMAANFGQKSVDNPWVCQLATEL